MGDVAERIAKRSAELVTAVVEGAPTPELLPNLDLLLAWMASPEAPEVASIQEELQSRGIDPRSARRLGLLLLEEALFSGRDSDPHRILGLERGVDKDGARTRYRLLMRVYHPDLSADAFGWLTARAERINDAYTRIQASFSSPSRPARRVAASSRSPDRRLRARRRRDPSRDLVRRLRRTLGRPRAVRRRVLLGILLACTALVVHTCIAHRSWKEWGPRSGASLVSSRVPGPLAVGERAR